jgi:hypothetical protein
MVIKCDKIISLNRAKVDGRERLMMPPDNVRMLLSSFIDQEKNG